MFKNVLMAEERIRAILSVEASPLDPDGELDDMEGEVIELPEGKESWSVEHGAYRYDFRLNGHVEDGMPVLRLHNKVLR